MSLQDQTAQDRFSDHAGGGVVRAGSRALPAVLMVVLALVASSRAAETLGPVGRTVASEVAAVRLLSDAIVRAVRNLSDQDKHIPAVIPERQVTPASFVPVCRSGDEPGVGNSEAAALLGWHRLDRPPPAL